MAGRVRVCVCAFRAKLESEMLGLRREKKRKDKIWHSKKRNKKSDSARIK